MRNNFSGDMADILKQTELRFDERFLEQYLAKRLISDPIVATVELVANSWDAGARNVEISLPSDVGGTSIVRDDGGGRLKPSSGSGGLGSATIEFRIKEVTVTVRHRIEAWLEPNGDH